MHFHNENLHYVGLALIFFIYFLVRYAIKALSPVGVGNWNCQKVILSSRTRSSAARIGAQERLLE